MTNEEMLDLIGERQKILLRDRTVQSEQEVPPFAFINIYAVRDYGVFKYLEVNVKIIAKGADSETYVDHPSKFTIALDESQHLPTELLIHQIQTLNFGYNSSTVSFEEVQAIRNYHVPNASLEDKAPIFITEDYMAEELCDDDYRLNENLVQATHMAFQAVLEDLESIFRQVKVAF